MGCRHDKPQELAWHPGVPSGCAVASAPDGAVPHIMLYATAARMPKHDLGILGW
jgi:hypothetical protein